MLLENSGVAFLLPFLSILFQRHHFAPVSFIIAANGAQLRTRRRGGREKERHFLSIFSTVIDNKKRGKGAGKVPCHLFGHFSNVSARVTPPKNL